eukprot:2837338-Rhodomonas_salina.1
MSDGGGGMSLTEAQVAMSSISASQNMAQSSGGGSLMIWGKQQPRFDGAGLSCGIVEVKWKCPAGETGPDGGPCEPCIEGTFKNDTGSQPCTQCPLAMWSPPGSSRAADCQCGRGYSAPREAVCEPCVPGTFKRSPGSEACLQCEGGSFQTESGASVCLQCPQGTYQDGSPAEHSCQNCGIGTSAPAGSSSAGACSQQFAEAESWAPITCAGSCEGKCRAFHEATGVLSDGSDSGLYHPNSNCSWIISPLNAVQVTLEFHTFSTQALSASGVGDVVTVLECSDLECQSSSILLTRSGSSIPNDTIVSSTGFMKVEFTSDDSAERDGFSASWTSATECDAGYFKVNQSACAACAEPPANAQFLPEVTTGTCAWQCNSGFVLSSSACLPCLDGTTSQDGGCVCRPGYTGSSCEA